MWWCGVGGCWGVGGRGVDGSGLDGGVGIGVVFVVWLLLVLL